MDIAFAKVVKKDTDFVAVIAYESVNAAPKDIRVSVAFAYEEVVLSAADAIMVGVFVESVLLG